MSLQMNESHLPFNFSKIINRIFIYLRPFFWKKIKKIIFNITLNDNLVISCNRGSTRKFGTEEFCCRLQINICNKEVHTQSSSIKNSNLVLPYDFKPTTHVRRFLPRGATLKLIFFGPPSFFLGFDSPLPPRFCLFLSSSVSFNSSPSFSPKHVI